MRRLRSTWLRWIAHWLVLAAAISLWQLWVSARRSPYFPPPSQILSEIHQLWFSGPPSHLFLTSDAAGNILPSLERIGIGLGISVALGIPLGIALGRSVTATAFSDPMLQFARSVPVVTAAPVFIALFKIGTQMEVATIAAGTIWPVLLNTIDGARTVDPLQIETARAFRLTGWDRLTLLIIPSALPKIFTGLRLSLSLSLILMVFSEETGATNGIGYEMLNASNAFDLPLFWAALLLLGGLGYALNALLNAAETTLFTSHRGMRHAT
jgi:ABC-type nitrate/sulfonate/bicarbonate transport system permease component